MTMKTTAVLGATCQHVCTQAAAHRSTCAHTTRALKAWVHTGRRIFWASRDPNHPLKIEPEKRPGRHLPPQTPAASLLTKSTTQNQKHASLQGHEQPPPPPHLASVHHHERQLPQHPALDVPQLLVTRTLLQRGDSQRFMHCSIARRYKGT